MVDDDGDCVWADDSEVVLDRPSSNGLKIDKQVELSPATMTPLQIEVRLY
jgi:hypothetical protein